MHHTAPQLRQSTANIFTGEAADSPRARKIRVALVNVGRITGISEWENKPV